MPQQLDATDKIRVSLHGSGTVDFVPVADVTLQPLSVTRNGTYEAVDAGVYGFSSVTANVPRDRVTGTIDGTTYVVTVDENGYLVYTPQEG